MKNENRKTIMLVAVMLTIFSVSAFAGTADSYGLEALWTKFLALITDKWLNYILIGVVAIYGMIKFHNEGWPHAVKPFITAFVIGILPSIITNVSAGMI